MVRRFERIGIGIAASLGSQYVELHCRSAFSFLEGASTPEDLVARAFELGQKAIAVTDMHGVYGAPRLHLAATKLEMRELVGAEVLSAAGHRLTLAGGEPEGV